MSDFTLRELADEVGDGVAFLERHEAELVQTTGMDALYAVVSARHEKFQAIHALLIELRDNSEATEAAQPEPTEP